jgi:hypothetical protein
LALVALLVTSACHKDGDCHAAAEKMSKCVCSSEVCETVATFQVLCEKLPATFGPVAKCLNSVIECDQRALSVCIGQFQEATRVEARARGWDVKF